MAKNKQAPKNSPAKPVPQPAAPVASAQAPVAALPEKWLLLLLVAIALLVNAATIRYDYTLDDPFFTKDNPLVKEGLSNVTEFFKHAAYYGVFKHHDASYRPLLLISFAAEQQFFGFNPQVSHLVNLLLFALQVATLYLLVRRIFQHLSPYIPFFIVLLFELHPIHTEVVASIKSRDELLALLLASATMLQSFRYVDTGDKKYLLTTALFFFLALMSKETPITYVAITPITLYFFRKPEAKQVLMAMIPYGAIATIYMLMRAAFIESDGEKVKIMVNNNALMAAGTYAEKLATALYIQLKYLVLLVLPHPLSYDYSFNQIPIIGMGDPKALLAIITLGGLLYVALRYAGSKNVFSYCILYYAASVAITANIFVDIGATMAERFVYTGSLGFCIALVFGLAYLLKADKAKLGFVGAGRNLFLVVGAISVLYAAKTMARNEDWKNNLALYESGAETAPNSWRAHNLLGVEYTKMISNEKDPAKKEQLFRDAISHFNKSIAILPGAEVYLLKGYAFEFAGNHDDSAIACYSATLRLDPNHLQAANNMGAVYQRRGMFPEAIKILGGVLEKDPNHVEALCNMAASHGNSGKYKEAEQYYLRAIKINPDQPRNVLQSMANIYRIMGETAKSAQYQELANKATH